jgi:hypothetical protein
MHLASGADLDSPVDNRQNQKTGRRGGVFGCVVVFSVIEVMGYVGVQICTIMLRKPEAGCSGSVWVTDGAVGENTGRKSQVENFHRYPETGSLRIAGYGRHDSNQRLLPCQKSSLK